MNRKFIRILKLVVLLAIIVVSVLAAGYFIHLNKKRKLITEALNRYELVNEWPQLPEGFVLGNPTGLAIDSFQNLVVFHRAGREWPLLGDMPKDFIAENTILILDKNNGKIVKQWGSGFFVMPHGLSIDRQNNIWVTDVGLHQVFKFSYDGKLLMTFGEAGIAGKDSLHFDQPTDVAITDDGSFYVSDGYGNSRVVKFSAEGKYLFEWGKTGSGEGEFDIPHGITLDEKENIYVADRGNKRIQIFDSNGKFLKQWKDESFGEICSVVWDASNKNTIAVDDSRYLKLMHQGSDLIVFDSSGVIKNRFGRSGNYKGDKCWYHDVAVDRDGNIYVGDITGNKLQKFKNKR